MRGGGGGGEIVEVQGGHIVRSTGRKDRHSKVCTAKGPRDRRVRLSAHTAIQFYDVQDRLGYDRPSKAVDWLIKKAKAAIDELAELPAWNPTATCSSAPQQQESQQQQQHHMVHRQSPVDDPVIASSSRNVAVGGRIPEQFPSLSQQLDNNNTDGSGKYKYNSGGSGFLPTSLDTDIADTIKSFFPMETATTSFQSYAPPPDLLSRTASGGSQQDLRLSLQSFQDPILLHHHQQTQNHHEQSPAMVPASVFGHGHGQYFSQRGPLQSSNTHLVRAWIDPSIATVADHHHHHYLSPAIHQASVSGAGFAAPGGFSGFHIPARIQGEEEHDGVSDKPSSASSDSRH
ncbi:hypothetical protein SESBI_48692 [Sesbania bispinosa]|nr:hypothetical protein SESBI_48692 [Sesbania bispinosa]